MIISSKHERIKTSLIGHLLFILRVSGKEDSREKCQLLP